MNDVIFAIPLEACARSLFQGFHLARSIFRYCSGLNVAVHVRLPAELDVAIEAIFTDIGCIAVRNLEHLPAGAGLEQIEVFAEAEAAHVVLLDAEMIIIDDICDVVRAGRMPAVVTLRTGDAGETLDSIGEDTPLIPYARVSDLRLATQGDPIHWAWSGEPPVADRSLDPGADDPPSDSADTIRILRYGADSLTPSGRINAAGRSATITGAVENANEFIAEGYQERLFWDLRYAEFPGRGSGVGSRGDNADYKRALLRVHGAERAESVLDVGCGDLEVIRTLELRGYLGIDQSAHAIEIARRARPDWSFIQMDLLHDPARIGSFDFVICFEVLLHQSTEARYRELVAALAAKTNRTLIVSGLDNGARNSSAPSVFFYESLVKTLIGLGVFDSVTRIGGHTSVDIYRCDRGSSDVRSPS